MNDKNYYTTEAELKAAIDAYGAKETEKDKCVEEQKIAKSMIELSANRLGLKRCVGKSYTLTMKAGKPSLQKLNNGLTDADVAASLGKMKDGKQFVMQSYDAVAIKEFLDTLNEAETEDWLARAQLKVSAPKPHAQVKANK